MCTVKIKLTSLNGWQDIMPYGESTNDEKVNLCNDNGFYIRNDWTDIWVRVET
jgi:hypothetical protein